MGRTPKFTVLEQRGSCNPKELQEALDKRMIAALASGTLMQQDLRTGTTSPAEECFLPGKETYIDRAEAQMRTGIYPVAMGAVAVGDTVDAGLPEAA